MASRLQSAKSRCPRGAGFPVAGLGAVSLDHQVAHRVRA